VINVGRWTEKGLVHPKKGGGELGGGGGGGQDVAVDTLGVWGKSFRGGGQRQGKVVLSWTGGGRVKKKIGGAGGGEPSEGAASKGGADGSLSGRKEGVGGLQFVPREGGGGRSLAGDFSK